MCFIMNDKQDWKDALQKDRDDSISVILDTIKKSLEVIMSIMSAT